MPQEILKQIVLYAKINKVDQEHTYTLLKDHQLDTYLVIFETSSIIGKFALAMNDNVDDLIPIFNREVKITENNGFTKFKDAVFNVNIQMNIPMKAKPYGEGKPTYPMYYQPKINGGRCIDELTEITETTNMFSNGKKPTLSAKEGGLIPVQHLIDQLNTVHDIFGHIIFDGEIYLFGKKCATINGAARNPKNPIHKDLALVIFDVILYGVSQFVRVNILNQVKRTMKLSTDVELELNLKNNKIAKGDVFFLDTDTVYDEKQARRLAEIHIDAGYEGIVLREKEAVYRQGKHVGNLYKMKKALFGWFKIVDITPKPIDVMQPLFILKNDKTNDLFECNPTGDHATNAKYLSHKVEYIGKMVQVKYYERTINELPFHANVLPETMKNDVQWIDADAMNKAMGLNLEDL